MGTNSIRVVVCEVIRNSNSPKILAMVRVPSRGLHRGYIVNQEEAETAIQESILEAERISKVKIRGVFLGIGGIGLESRQGEGQVAVTRADSEINELDINRALELSEANITNVSNFKVIHTIPLVFKLDGKKILGRPEGMKGNKLEVKTLFICVLNQHINNLVKAVESANVSVEDVIASPLAASFQTLSNTQKAAGAVLANVGAQTTSIVVYEEGLPISVQVLPIGSSDVTNDIALGLRLSLEDAEKLKVSLGQSNLSIKKKLDEIIEARLSDMFELIETQLKKIGRNELLPAGIIFTGSGSSLPDIEKLAKNYLKLPARIAGNDTDTSSRGQVKDPAWSVAYGLCLFGLGSEPDTAISAKIFRQAGNKFIKWLKEFLP